VDSICHLLSLLLLYLPDGVAAELGWSIGRQISCGSFAAGPFAIGPGVLVDILDKGECGNAMGILICICWIGPALGTVISGCFELKKDWRWSMYACLWLGSFTMIPMLTVPETHSPTVLAQKAKLARHQGHDIEAAGRLPDQSCFSSTKLLWHDHGSSFSTPSLFCVAFTPASLLLCNTCSSAYIL
jgi:MFS family permease